MTMDHIIAGFERIMAVVTTPGRKGAAFDRALLGILGVTALMFASDGGLSAEEGQVSIEGVIWITGLFTGTNVGEHFAKRGGGGQPSSVPVSSEPVSNVVSGLWR